MSLNLKQIGVPLDLHTKLKELAKRDNVTLWMIILFAVKLYIKEYPEARDIKVKEYRGRPRTKEPTDKPKNPVGRPRIKKDSGEIVAKSLSKHLPLDNW